jgi:hypothetical protein
MKNLIEKQKLRQEGAVKVLANMALTTFLDSYPTMGTKDCCSMFINHFKEVKKEMKNMEKREKEIMNDFIDSQGS